MSLPSGSADAAQSSFLDISELSDSLILQRAILASLRDATENDENNTQIAEVKQEITRLQQVINKARSKPQGSTLSSTRPLPPSAHPAPGSKNSTAMMNGNRPDAFSGRTPNNGNLTPASFATSSASGQSNRKRSYGTHLNGDDDVRSQNKSRRTTPSPLQTAITTPSTGSGEFPWDDDNMEIVDLTGDDATVDRIIANQMGHKQEEERYKREKMDEELARTFQQGGFPDSLPSSPGPSAFDRMLGRSSQVQGPMDLPSRSAVNDGAHAEFGRPGNGVQRTASAQNDWTQMYQSPAIAGPSRSTASPAGITLPVMPGMYDEVYGPGPVARQDGVSQFGSMPFNNSYVPSQPAPGNPMRPGTLHGGTFDPLNPLQSFQGLRSVESWGADYQPKPEPSSDYLGNIIDNTNQIDWQNGLDEYGRPLSDRLRSYYDDLNDDPRKTAEEIQDLLANIRPDADIPMEDRIGTPDALRYPLYPYQQLALQWMINTEDTKNKAGILADDMGLGKTVSTIALMVSRPSPDRKVKTNLIVAPVALLKQWENEIKKKIRPGHALSCLVLHGKTATFDQIRTYDVVLTSYGKLGQEYKRFQKWIEQHPGADASIDAELARSCPLVHPRSRFYRVVLDEAQCIKNINTLNSKGAGGVRSTYRWCLTGTPMMNGVHELYSLIKFLKIAPYHDQKEFSKAFGSLSPKSGGRRAGEAGKQKAMAGLRILLKAIMLRRMKDSLLDGKPIITLPPKNEEVVHATFSDDEMSFYRDLESRTQTKFNKYLRAGTVGKNYSNVLVLLLRLRQACCHPHLNLDVEYAPVNGDATMVDMIELAKSLTPAVIQRVREAAEEGFNCPVCLDAVLDPAIAIPCGHDACSECFARLYDSAVTLNIEAGNEGSAAKCPECRGPISAQKVISFSTFKEVHMPKERAESEAADGVNQEDIETASEASETDSDDDADDSDVDSDDEVDANGNLRDFIVKDDEVSDVASGAETDGDNDDFRPAAKPKKTKKRKSGKSKKGKEKEKKEEIKPHMLKTLRHEAKKNKEDYRRYMKYLRKNWMPSAKVDECCKILQGIQASGDKTIIFSQFTFFLDLLEIPIKHELKIKSCRYDGGMSRNQRDAAAQDFQDVNSSTKVMLVSLKAGNSGLNLTSANHVIIMDPFWNPYVEMQAVDRAYRIGQQKPVQVHRILIESTVEDRIMELQEKKRALVDAALDEGESKSLGRLSQRDLAYLFGVSTRGD